MTGETHPPVHPGDQINAAMIARIYDGMRACTLPKQEWTHGGHLVCGCAILADLGLDEAEAQMPGMIRRYNISTGGENTDTDGYHHTITLFYLRIIAQFIASHSAVNLAAQATALLASPLADKAYALSFYSEDHLFSGAARKGWAEPDIKPLPQVE